MHRLSDICSVITDGSHYSPVDEGIGYPMLSVKDMGDIDFDFSTCKHVGEVEYSKLVANGCKPMVNDVVVAKDGSYLKSAFPIIQDRDIAVLSSIAILRPNTSMVLPAYLSYYLKSSYVYRTVSLNYITGTALKRIILAGIRKLPIELPGVDVQEKRVDLLDTIDRIIKMRKCQLRTLDQLIKARFVEMFGDPIANEKEWKTKPLLSMGACKNGMNFHYDDSGVELNCLGVGDFKDYSIITDTAALPIVSLNEMPSSEYLLQDDDIVFVRSNGNKKMVGRSIAVYPENIPTTFSGFCIRYRRMDNSVITPYLLRVLKAESMRQKMYGRGANIQNLNQQTLSSLDIPIPPKEMQEQFAAFVTQVDKSKVVDLSVFTNRAKSYII